MDTRGFCLFDTAIGRCGIAWGPAGLTGVQLPEADEGATRRRMAERFAGATECDPPVQAAIAIDRIAALLRGGPDDLRSIPLDHSETPAFARRVYEALRAVPPGATTSYGALSAAIGAPGAARAVGRALGANPFAPVVPCHRVLAAGARPGGFSASGGLLTKFRMLRIEGVRLRSQPGLFDD